MNINALRSILTLVAAIVIAFGVASASSHPRLGAAQSDAVTVSPDVELGACPFTETKDRSEAPARTSCPYSGKKDYPRAEDSSKVCPYSGEKVREGSMSKIVADQDRV